MARPTENFCDPPLGFISTTQISFGVLHQFQHLQHFRQYLWLGR